MISRRIFHIVKQQKIPIIPSITKCNAKSFSTNSDDEKSDDGKKKRVDKKKTVDKKKQSNEALEKLNLLLNDMIKEDVQPTKSELKLAKPKQRRVKKESGTESRKVEPVEKQLVDAAKSVAETLGGDTKKTESELLAKLLSSAKENEEDKGKTSNLSDVIAGMKIEREKPQVDVSRSAHVRKVLKQDVSETVSKRVRYGSISKRARFASLDELSEQMEQIDLVGSEPLNIFKKENLTTPQVEMKTWEKLEKRSLRLAVTHPPDNYFQEMILWTEQGKVWKFPIDNEQGMEEEQNVSFADHIFLEQHLESWCPQKGPIRHFMELVCVGLSKNPYLTVQAKKDHIFWYRDYFESKRAILEEVGAIPAIELKKIPTEITDSSTK